MIVTNIMPVIFARALQTLREFCVMPRLVNTDYSTAPAAQGETVNWQVPTALTVTDVTPSNVLLNAPAPTPLRASVTLNRWREVPVPLTDKVLSEIGDTGRSLYIDEQIKALANDINAFILGRFIGLHSSVGTPGTSLFAGADYTARTVPLRTAMRRLDDALAPGDGRSLVLHTSTYADILGIPEFVRVNEAGRDTALRSGVVGEILGFNVARDQQVPLHAATNLTAGAATVNGVNALGATTVSIAKATNTSPLIAGDVIAINHGGTVGIQQYAVTAGVTLAVGNTNVSINRGLVAATAGAEAVTLVSGASPYRVNLAFHRDAIAFASRPLSGESNTENMMQIVDPVSGVAFRMELQRQHRQTVMMFDCLYGANTLRPELGIRFAE